MRLFTKLYSELDGTTRTSEKQAALVRYFGTAPAADAAWALYFLTGRKLKRNVNGTQIRQWAAEVAGLPVWLVDECYDAVGDLGETVALLLPESKVPTDVPLHVLVQERLIPLGRLEDAERKALLLDTWRLMDTPQRLVWNKIITGSFRVGVSSTLVTRAVAAVTGVPPAEMAHRLAGNWKPTADVFEAFTGTVFEAGESLRPYPFYLSYGIEGEPDGLGPFGDWQVEWKWDGIRSQLLRRAESHLWSRGEELLTERFPEIMAASAALPAGTVLDGELLAWRDGRPLPFGELQRRIGRKNVDARTKAEVPVHFLAYDLLEWEGVDMRTRPLSERRALLETLFGGLRAEDSRFDPLGSLGLSPLVEATDWDGVKSLFRESRSRSVEGFMIKRKDSPYGVGRQKGAWWKWKIDPYTIDAVLIYAQRGHGRRASLLTDYTFALWDNGTLVPFAKAYSGLTDVEIAELDRLLRQSTIERFGPIRSVKPTQVFELGFEGIQSSARHKSGVAVRFPRILRWRKDKAVEEADTLDALRALALAR